MSDSSPYQTPSAPVGYVPSRAPQLKELKNARWTLIILGIIYCGVILFQWNSAQKEIDAADASLKAQGSSLEEALAENPEAASQVRLGKILVGVGCSVAVAFVVLGFLVYRFPVGAPLTGLILYGLDQISGAVMDPSSIAKGVIIKIIIVACLIRAVKAGLNWKRSQVVSYGGGDGLASTP